ATPIGYFHVFLSGIVAARMFILLCLEDKDTGGPPSDETVDLVVSGERAPLILRYGCIV
ncbi:avt5, partial [Symbiodinium pilosum]